MIVDKDVIKLNILICLYFLFEKNKLISHLTAKLNNFGVFNLYEDENFLFEKIKISDVLEIERYSYKVKDMHIFLYNLIKDMTYLNSADTSSLNIESLNFFKKFIDKNITNQILYKDTLEIISIVQSCKSKSIYKNISPKLYRILKGKNLKIIKVYLFVIFFLVCIKNKSMRENINFKIFITEPLIDLKEFDYEI